MTLSGLGFGVYLAVLADLRTTVLDRGTPRTAAERRHLAELAAAIEAAAYARAGLAYDLTAAKARTAAMLAADLATDGSA